MNHPLIVWGGIVFTIISVVLMVGGAYVYAENLMYRIDESLLGQQRLRVSIEEQRAAERFGDEIWVELDKTEHNAIMESVNSLRHLIQNDGTLLYQLGLRDGRALACTP